MGWTHCPSAYSFTIDLHSLSLVQCKTDRPRTILTVDLHICDAQVGYPYGFFRCHAGRAQVAAREEARWSVRAVRYHVPPGVDIVRDIRVYGAAYGFFALQYLLATFPCYAVV